MLYLNNAELAKKYAVSLRTVFNWIESAKQGRLKLILHEKDGKVFIANTSNNILSLERIVAERKKYRNFRSRKTVKPLPEFYEIYSPDQITDLVANLEMYHEILTQYTYFGDGATYWDAYSQQCLKSPTTNSHRATLELMRINFPYIESLMHSYQSITLVDIGSGNAILMRPFIDKLLRLGKRVRYISYDFSEGMMAIARANIERWFGGVVEFVPCVRDIRFERFSDLLRSNNLQSGQTNLNLIFELGGTLLNLFSVTDAVRVVSNSMGRDCYFIRTSKLDTETARGYFDFSVVNTEIALTPFSLQDKFLLDLLGIEDSYYDVEIGYDEQKRRRYIQVKLKVAIDIDVLVAGNTQRISFNKNEKILLWYHWHETSQGIVRQLDGQGLYVVHSSHTRDGQFLLTISKNKRLTGS